KIRYSIPEEMEEGSVVGNIAKDLGLNIRELSARGVRVVSRTKTQYFTVNVENGNLLLNENIDREQICTYAPQCLLTVQILVENPMHLYPAEVEIQDINDNAPMFPEQEIVLEISEITEPGTRFPFDNAHDPDIGVNSLQSYVLSPNYYFIVLQTSKEGEKYAELVLEKALDREKEAVHVLSLTAMDGGLPVKSSTVKITIIVLDANDNAPLFTERVYKVSLQEGVSVGAVVLQVNAIDVDEGSYGEVTYSFNKISEKARQVFEVDSKTGEVIATGKVDFEEASSYEIEIRAKDGGGLTAYCKVLLEIIDINDNPPVITVTSFSTSVSEDSLPGTVIALLNVDDPDSGENGKVLCFVPPNFPFNLTSSIDNFYTLATDRVLDRELVSEYNITIIAIDRGVPSLTTSKSVLLKISDINDNPPIFNQTSYTAYVNENNPPGSFICSVKATDLDWDQNARLTYYITETQVHGKLVSSYISINPENGNIQALRSFDHEQFRDFHIQVIAQDAGSPPLSSNVIVNVFILDQNDNAPEILYPPRRDGASAIELTPRSAKRGYLVTKVVAVDADSGQNAWLSYKLLKATESNSFSIGLHSGENDNTPKILYPSLTDNSAVIELAPRSSDAGDLVTKVVAVDADSGQNGWLSYELLKFTEPGLFQIGLHNGEIRTSRPFLDTDVVKQRLLVLVKDNGQPSLSARVTQNILLAENFELHYSIPEEMDKGYVVGNIANDFGLDIRELTIRGFRIISTGKKQYFDVDTENGNLFLNEKIDREQICRNIPRCILTFQVLVENPMNLYRGEVEVQDINDNAPRFPKEEIILEINELTQPGTRFSFKNAQDPDIGINSLQSYKISQNEYFTLFEQTSKEGQKYTELVLEKSLDREKEQVHHLTLTAIDGGEPTRSGTVRIRIIVLDVNDNAPSFLKTVYKASLEENVPIGTLVLQVNATDKDEGSNGEVTYSFSKLSETASQVFKLDSKTGKIKVTGIIDFEEAVAYEMEVQAKDGGGLTTYCKVLLEIIDVNDNPPEITVTSFTSPIPEDSLPGTTVALLNVDDLDSGENGKVLCSISPSLPLILKSSFDNYYTLTTARTLDRERMSEYNITITATDKGFPPLTISKSIWLKISDVNDNPPSFNQTSYTAYVRENNSPGSAICVVKAMDLDWDKNAHVIYSIMGTQIHGKPVSSYFLINPETGNIQALRSFDHEQFRDLQIQVKAQDTGFPPLSSNVTVNVFVLDQNDNAPEILYPPQTSTTSAVELAPRSAEVGYLVTKVVAFDADSGQNAWLSYTLLKATEPKSFQVGLHTGEVRTSRNFLAKDGVKQTVVISVKDNGQPSLSTTVTLNILVADNFPEILPGLERLSIDKHHSSNLTLYLVISLASVSFLFLCFIIVLIIFKIRHWKNSTLFHSLNARTHPSFPPCYAEVDGLKTPQQAYSYEVYLTTNSSKSEFTFLEPRTQSVCENNPSADTAWRQLQTQELIRVNEGHDVFSGIKLGFHSGEIRTTRTVLDTDAIKQKLLILVKDNGQPTLSATVTLSVLLAENFNEVLLDMDSLTDDLEYTSNLRLYLVVALALVSFLFLLTIMVLLIIKIRKGQIRYSIPEEMEKGSIVGNIGNDLGLAIKDLSDRDIRIVSTTKEQYFIVNVKNGNLLLNEKIDRELICRHISQCILVFEIILENPMALYGGEVEIQDINDNSPRFPKQEIVLKINELTEPRTRFSFENAQDPDIGVNSLQNYQLSPSKYFSLRIHTNGDSQKYAELALEKALDREKDRVHLLTLTATDGGVPTRSGTVNIWVIVLDANDNAPTFTEDVYQVSLVENVSKFTVVIQVDATDTDEGSNGEVNYSFSKISETAREIFEIDAKTGKIIVTGNVDFEKAKYYEMEIKATDPGGLATYCKVLLKIIDINDNPPEIIIKSFSTPISEDCLPGTVVSLLNVNDHDSGANGQVTCAIDENLPFKLKSSFNNYYFLATDGTLDREKMSEYNITITATDNGVPPLTTSTALLLKVSDINDNLPVFNQISYTVYIRENNPPGSFISTVNATDVDWGQNARLIYSVIGNQIHGNPISSFITINPENGNIQALRSFDHEQFRDLQFQVNAQDSGSPPLSSNVTVKLFVLDQNDNAPEILYPSQTDSSSIEVAFRSAEPNSLITKVVAVDADSGQNAWLSYKLIKATEPNTFEVGLYTGEIRTTRLFLEKDAVKQTLIILVKDNGQPSLSTTVTLKILVANNFPEILPDLDRLSNEKDYTSNITLYLVISLAAVSFLFLCFITLLMVIKIRHWKSSKLFHSLNVRTTPNFPPCYSEVEDLRTFPHAYSYEVHLTTNSSKNELKFLKPCQQNAFERNSADVSEAELQRQEQNITQRSQIIQPGSNTDSAFGQVRYSIPEEMEKGTVIGNIANDLGLPIRELSARGVRLVSRTKTQYFDLNIGDGNLLLNEKIDREQICTLMIECLLHFQVLVENPMHLYAAEVEIQDINDNSNVTVKIYVLDQNDNAPKILYPSQTDSSSPLELAPRSAEAGDLVTKVVAVDADSGQNAWLSYKLLKATEPKCFSVGLHTGEIRTTRLFLDKDAVKQSIVILVKDNGVPSLSSTVTLSIVVADNFPEILPDLDRLSSETEYSSNLTLYLVIALASVSFVFLGFIIVLMVIKIRHWQSSRFFHSLNVRSTPNFPPCYADIDGVRTLPQNYAYEVYLTTNSTKSELKYVKPYLESVSGQVRYSIPEEMEKGTIVGNIANDSGLPIRELSARGVRLVSRTKTQYFDLNIRDGNLLLNEKIDREQICTRMIECLLPFQVLVENPMHLYGAEVEIQDINDNSPRFQQQEIVLKISELTEPGTRFSFENAKDPDVGINSVQRYKLSPNDHFKVNGKNYSEGPKSTELVLEKALDREKNPFHLLTVTATDGGVPARSGTMQIRIIVIDANDNTPVFTKSVYKASLAEHAAKGTIIIEVNAIDLDEGSNGEITYSFSKIAETGRQIFDLDSITGEIKISGNVNFEETTFYEMEIKATDGGDRSAYCKVLLEIIDINDNPPEITITSISSPIPEDSLPGTVIALLNVDDPDSGENGNVLCSIPENLPFTLKSSLYNYYTLATERTLDREQFSEYNITITATDKGVPPLTTRKSILLKVSDINDNPPIFNQTSYTAYIRENNPLGSVICSIKATDLDWDQNARLTYFVTETQIHGIPLSSYISINPDNGNIQALQSFDHEQFRYLQFLVKAQDSGSPPLSSNVTVKIYVLDQNDNAPEILYPSQTDSSSPLELAPRSAEAGDLVTKVVAVDADSGQNAWLSYKLLKAAEPKCFSVGLHTGEIRTARLFLDKDAIKQTIVILVKDNGVPSLSSTVTLHILVADNFPEILPDLDRFSTETEYSSNLTLYLVIALASVSFVFLGFIIVLMVIKLRHWQSSRFFHSLNARNTPNFPPCYADIDGVRTLPQNYSYE
uniref:Cadherin domain-containing protein n=1 Tax=Latimeria chalumnae TaxID=7897 RepID=H3A381_LATCH